MLRQSILPPGDAGVPEAADARPAISPNIAVFLVGLAFTAALFAFVMNHTQEEEELQQAYQEEAVPLSVVLSRSIQHSLDTVSGITGLYAASSEVERDAFRAYTEKVLVRNDGIQAAEWIPRISAKERTAYEAAARRDGLADFQITERNSAGDIVPAATRNEYFPVYCVEPLDGNEAALGFDLAFDPVRLEALNRARDTGRTAATQAIRLVQETG
ncbi:MAG: CHASE1-domain containing sensor protein, partial [Alphaproteobacteria bacterium]